MLHEMAHMFLESRRRMSLLEGISDPANQDWATLLKWLEIEDVDFSQPLSEADAKRWINAQEKFAAAFEQYLAEGRAPTVELARAFRAFKKWLLAIYKAVKNIMYTDAEGCVDDIKLNQAPGFAGDPGFVTVFTRTPTGLPRRLKPEERLRPGLAFRPRRGNGARER